ncbi:amino acid adenylation domain-containing protein [Streptomyces sediminimaris]|uniref:amino acid adenylation domain-containing protein n=1 Tax=Streptomyces sediminimaris TaxID=3383721 RepID=UPI00399A0E3D
MPDPTSSPLTAYQRDIWAESAIDDSHPQFNCVIHERLTGRVDVPALRTCLARAARRHDALALSFDERDGVPFQWVAPEVASAADGELVRVVDLSDGPDPRAACDSWVERSLARPFPLRRGRMVELTLLREGPGAVHLVVKAHHIVTDGYGILLFTEQVFEDYERVRAGAAPPERTAPSCLAAVGEDARYHASPQFLADRDFHRRTHGDAEPALFTRAPVGAGARTGRYSFTLDSALVRRLREQRRSVFPVVAAAFATWLGRVHRTREVTIGVPLLNRRTGEELATVGHYANILPLRLKVPPTVTAREVAEAAETGTEELQRHERLALGDLLRALPRRGGGAPQLFDVTLSYLPVPPSPPVAGMVRETTGTAPAHARDALAVHVLHPRGTDEVAISLVHALDVFDEDFPVEALAGHIAALIRGAVEEPDRPIGSLRMLGAAERRALDAAARGPRVPHPGARTLHDLFEEQARRAPDRCAVLAGPAPGSASWTFGRLDSAADQVARALRAAGVGPGERVAVLVERGPRLLVSVLGVLKAGGAYVPVDPGYPPERIAFMLRDSRAKAVLTDSGSPDVTGAGGAGSAAVLRVGDLLDGPDTPLDPAATARAATARDLAYVIYTSGSTGRPKGVMVEHRSVVNRLAWMQRAHPIGEGDVILHKTPASFDVSVWELFWWALVGAAVTLAPVGAERDPRALVRVIAERQVTVTHFVPSMFGPFLDLLEESPDLRADVRSLRYVFCSGEALPPPRVEQFNRVFRTPGGDRPAPKLVNLYGPTEAAVDVSCFECPADPARPVRRVPIGRPIDNTELYVLGEQDEPQPAGAPGELCIGGVQVARGYLDRPELTADRFADDPFTPGGRLYRTGDLARWLADGTLEYLGRLDGQVKIRGNRVETGEVAAALAALPGVRDAVVVDRTDSSRGVHLVGYYVAEEDRSPRELRAHLRERLPEFMVPALFRRIEHVPLTPSGKTDRAALPAPRYPAGPAAGRPPADSVEARLAAVWAEVLQVEHVGVHDDYYALGGDSITVLRIRTLAEKRGLYFSPADLVRHPTVASLAARVSTAEDASAAGPALAPLGLIPRVDRARLAGAQDAYPLSRLQLGLLYHSSRTARPAVYRDVFRYTLEVAWEETAFRHAFARLTARHPALRSSFDLAHHSEPVQIVQDTVTGGLDVVDLRSRAASGAGDATEEEILGHVEQRRHHRYALEHAPLYLMRAYVLPSTVELVFSFHHALLDGGSVANLIGELLQDYGHLLGLATGPVPDTPLPSAAHFVRDERRALDSADSRRYWQQLLEGAEVPALDTLRPYQAPGDDGQITRHVVLPDDLAEKLRRLARDNALPLKSVFAAAHCQVLRLLAGTDDVTTGVITHGRPDLENAERATGLFLNTVPLRLRTRGTSWLDQVREVFRQERLGHPHRRYPLSAIQEDHGAAVVRTAFNYVRFRQLDPVLTLPGVRLREFRAWEETDFELLANVYTELGGERLRLRLDCDGRAFSPAQADQLAEVWIALLRRMADHPTQAPDLAFLAPRPVRAGTGPDAGTAAARPGVVRRFRERAAATPDATAVVTGDQRWSYARLLSASEAVARRLLAEEPPPGARVGVAVDRSPRAVAVLLGTLMAGAAVVPLDTGFPPERVAAMLRQARPFRVVADARHTGLVGGAAPLLPAESVTEPVASGCELPEPEPRAVAYVLFTSGSTGAPKGVMMPHRGLANLVAWQNGRPSGAVGGATLQYAPLSFDVSFQEIFSTLCGGGTLHLVQDSERRDMPALLRRIDREGIERVFFPYVGLQQFAEAARALGIAPRRLRVLISSGEQLRMTDEIRGLLAALPGALLENHYGPTETHAATAFTMSGDPAVFPALPPIGRAIDGAGVHVLDSRMRPVPTGAQGELHIGGPGLSLGYLDRPDLTEERFVDDPFTPGGRLYRTGDLARVLPGGDIAYVGRADAQVKIRGHRVEPAEAELAVSRLAADDPGIREAAVVARRGPDGDTFLAAFLTGDRAEADLDALRSRLREQLPDHLVPSRYAWLPALPLSPSGKRDDAALRRVPLTAVDTSAATTAPRDAYEQALAETLADLLRLPAVGVHSSMFDLGGTSLTAMRLVVSVEQRYGVTIPLSAFLAAPTVAALADHLRSSAAVPAFDPLVPVRPEGTRRPLFLVHPMGGNVLCYLPFARHLPADQPLHALQAAGADPGVEPLRSVPALAASYVAALRRVQPRGPYTIGGWSFGGLVAFEMARRLTAAGEEVADLVVLDTVAAAPGARTRQGDDRLLGWFFWELLLTLGGPSPRTELPATAGTTEERFAHMADIATRSGVLPAGSSASVMRRLFRVYEANWAAALDYRPPASDTPLTLIRAADPLPEVLRSMHDAVGSRHRDPANGWRLLTHRVDVVGVPGDHLSIMKEPHVEHVAKTVGELIRRRPRTAAALSPGRD